MMNAFADEGLRRAGSGPYSFFSSLPVSAFTVCQNGAFGDCLPASLDQYRNHAVYGINVDDGVHVTAARVTCSRPVHHLRFHGVFDEQKVAARHLSTGLPDRARLRERETRLSQQDGSSKSDDDTSLHWTLLSCCATRHDTARQSLAG